MKTKTKIEKHLQKKVNPSLVRTIIEAKKNKSWLEVAAILSSPRKNRRGVNLDKIDKESKEKETIVVPGKVLSMGNINKKIKVVSLSFSEKAKEKLLKAKIEFSSILEEIKKNPEARGVRILTNIGK